MPSTLREFLTENGLSLTWLAGEIKMSESHLRYYAGRGLPKALELKIKAVFKRLGISLANWKA